MVQGEALANHLALGVERVERLGDASRHKEDLLVVEYGAIEHCAEVAAGAARVEGEERRWRLEEARGRGEHGRAQRDLADQLHDLELAHDPRFLVLRTRSQMVRRRSTRVDGAMEVGRDGSIGWPDESGRTKN